MSKEAARVEMDRFRGVAEYETRKIFGQHTAFKQVVGSEPSGPERDRRNTEPHTATMRRVPEEPTLLVAGADPGARQLEIFKPTSEVGK